MFGISSNDTEFGGSRLRSISWQLPRAGCLLPTSVSDSRLHIYDLWRDELLVRQNPSASFDTSIFTQTHRLRTTASLFFVFTVSVTTSSNVE
jgi:hypothetical protein